MMSQMTRTFTLESMDTYFRDYVPCPDHQKEPITNFCSDSKCLKFLCPECVELHSKTYANHPINAIKTCIKKTSDQLRDTIRLLQGEINRNFFLQGDNSEQLIKQLLRELDDVRKNVIEDINNYFREKEKEILMQTSKYSGMQSKVNGLKKQLNQAIEELKMLDRHLFTSSETVKAIKKANSLNHRGVSDHFRQTIDTLQKELSFNLTIVTNQATRDQLRINLNNLIGIKGKDTDTRASKVQAVSRGRPYSPPIPVNDKLFEKTSSFRIETQNYFRGEPFLHFFEVEENAIHIAKIADIEETGTVEWLKFPLQINFKVPSFHRSVATEQGHIFVIGGTRTESLSKSKTIYQYNPQNHSLIPLNSELLSGRSSHTLLCLDKLVYIMGGIGEEGKMLSKCELFNPQSGQVRALKSSKYAISNCCVCAANKDYIIKLGGVFANGQSNDHMELYNVKGDYWSQLDPTIQDLHGEFGLLSCSGWAPLNDRQIFIFGGYHQEGEFQNSKMSFVLEYNKSTSEYFIKYVNLKNLPIANGFWSPQSIVHNGSIYALQNKDGEAQDQCQQNERTVLVFNGRTWTTYLSGR